MYAVDDDFAHGRFIRNGEINWIRQRDRCSSPSLRAVAAGAVLRIESGEFHNLVWSYGLRILFGSTRGRRATTREQEAQHRERT